MRLLQESGIPYRGVNKYDFLMTDRDAIVFDFEVTTMKEVVTKRIR